jgi:hypothetical protein
MKTTMSEVYLVISAGEVHSMNECPSEFIKDITYIKITHYPEESQSDIKLEYYNGKEWLEVTP